MEWNSIKDKKPLAYLSGDWDGKKSDKVLAYATDGNYYVVEMYEGILDGYEFCDFYASDGCYHISKILFWSEIVSPV
jgi:hypothetical protein